MTILVVTPTNLVLAPLPGITVRFTAVEKGTSVEAHTETFTCALKVPNIRSVFIFNLKDNYVEIANTCSLIYLTNFYKVGCKTINGPEPNVACIFPQRRTRRTQKRATEVQATEVQFVVFQQNYNC